MRTTGLVRVTVAAPDRRIDVALPEHSVVAEIVPGLLRYAGEQLADEGVTAGGWVLRRADGSRLDFAVTLGSQRVRDGEVLHLVPSSTDWPELEYDDVVDAIATGAGRTGRMWAPRHTRQAGLALGALSVLLILVEVLRSVPWPAAAGWSLAAAVFLLLTGTILSRALGDSSAGTLLGALALPFAFMGGALLLAGDRGLSELGTAHLLSGSAMLLLASLVAFLGIADRPAVFVAGIMAALLGIVGSWLATTDSLEPFQAAALVIAALLAFSPGFGPLSIRLGRVPMPVLPHTTADLVRDDPQAPRQLIYQAVIRADAFLTGLLAGSCVAGVVCQLLLVLSGRTSAYWYVGVLTVGFLLRARLYPVVRHRIPFLVIGVAGLVALAIGPLAVVPQAGLVLLLTGALVMAVGTVASTRPLSPYLGRYAELLEVFVILAVIPVCCAVLGLYAVLRGLGG
jgi:type VII secretion integral membrane protein EccD